MLFNSFQFIWLFPLIFVVYYSLTLLKSDKLQNVVGNGFLLVVSYLLYMQWNAAYTLFLFGITLITFTFALLIDVKRGHKNKLLITAGVILTFLPLLIFKYYSFIMFQVGAVLSSFNIGPEMAGLNWAVPIGISFYTFQAVGYLWDVYRSKFSAERNFADYMLFVSFFPQILSGPISRYSELMPQIKSCRRFDYAGAVQGCRWLLWGMFLKIVLADRIGLNVDSIVNNYQYQSGINCAIGAILYSIQIYGDFAGYSLMAIGVGKLMGFTLINNFNRPYFAASVTEFWKRWHISLTRWLVEYVYIPLGGSRKGSIKTYRNIIITFLVSGLWHGANWTFIFWGLLHGLAQIFEKALGIQKCTKGWIRPFRIILTFAFVTLAWIFFRMPTISDAWHIIVKIFTNPGTLTTSLGYAMAMFLAIFIVFAVEWLKEYHENFERKLNRHVAVRWTFYIFILTFTILYGVMDTSSFIYVNF